MIKETLNDKTALEAGRALEKYWKDNKCTGDWGVASFWFLTGWELCVANADSRSEISVNKEGFKQWALDKGYISDAYYFNQGYMWKSEMHLNHDLYEAWKAALQSASKHEAQPAEIRLNGRLDLNPDWLSKACKEVERDGKCGDVVEYIAAVAIREYLRHDIPKREMVNQWRTLDTAPQTGEWIRIGYSYNGKQDEMIVRYSPEDKYWINIGGGAMGNVRKKTISIFTHWQPINKIEG